MAGADRSSGRVTAVSTWDTEEHARWTVDADAVRDIGSKLRELGLQTEPADILEVTAPTT
jgi:hypothetical protein